MVKLSIGPNKNNNKVLPNKNPINQPIVPTPTLNTANIIILLASGIDFVTLLISLSFFFPNINTLTIKLVFKISIGLSKLFNSFLNI